MSSMTILAEDNFEKVGSDYVPQATVVVPAKTSLSRGDSPKEGGRMLFIDGLRGVAALFVMLFHFYTPLVSPLYAYLHDSMPFAIDWALMQGFIGVQIFFVLSGFVIAYTLRNEICTPRFAGNFMVRRSIRLDPPYWTVIFITCFYRSLLWHDYTKMIYAGVGTPKLLMNMFYLVGFFGQTPIVGVAWTLCLEVQFYVVFIVILAIFHRVRESISPRAASWAFGLTFVPLTVFSLFWYFGEAQFSFFGTWFMFAIGATLAWTITKQIHERWIWIFLSAAVTGQLWLLDFRAMVAVTTVLLIYSAARFNKMSTWLSWGWLQKLGKISYSLYLCHVLIGLGVISIILNNGDNSRFVAVVAYIAASLMSIGAATVLHTYVEAPCVKLAKLLKPARSTSVVVKEIVARASANDPMPGNLAAV